MTIKTKTSNIFHTSDLNMRSDIGKTIFTTPIWELQRANFDNNHTQIKNKYRLSFHYSGFKCLFIVEKTSIFTAELMTILMALNYLVTCPKDIFQIIFCVDSKSVLKAIQSLHLRVRSKRSLQLVI